MRRTTVGLTTLLALFGCNPGDGQGDGNGNGNGNGNGHGPTARAEGNSTASMNDMRHDLVDGVAGYSQAKKSLRVALSSFAVTPTQARLMTDLESDIRLIPSREPYLELTFTLKDLKKPVSKGNIEAWRVTFRNFGNMPMTLNKGGSQGIQQLDGRLEAGGTIHVQASGEDTWEVGNDKRVYRWSLNHRVPILGR